MSEGHTGVATDADAGRVPRRAILLLALATFTAVACTRATDPLIDLIAKDFGVSAGNASIVITLYGMAYGLLQVFYGPVGDRIGKFRVVFITCALSTVGTFACAWATSLEWLAIARLVSGATAGALFPMSLAWLSDIIPYERRQAMLAKFVVANFLGSSLGSILAGWMAERWGWRSIFLLLSALFFLVAIALYLELRRNAAAKRPAAHGIGPGSFAEAFGQIATYLRDRQARNFLVMIALESVLMLSPIVFIPLHGQREFNLSPSESAVLMGAVLAGGMGYLAAAGPLTRRLGMLQMVIVGALIATLTLAGMVFAPDTPTAVVLLLAFGFGSTLLHNTFMTRATQFSPQARGVSVTLFTSCQYVSIAVGVWLDGRVVDLAGTSALFALAAVGLPTALLIQIRRIRSAGAGAPAASA
jgi:predicted MFS family arabinose efflux permease